MRSWTYNSSMSSSLRHRRWLSISVKTVRRHRRDSFARQAAYACRVEVENPRTGRRFDFAHKGPVEDSGLLGWEGDLQSLATAASSAERRVKAVEGRTVIVALPHEFHAHERKSAVLACAKYLEQNFRVAVVWALHPPPPEGDYRNWHAHLLMTARRVSGYIFGEKTRELDELKTGSLLIYTFRSWWTAQLNEMLVAAGHRPNLEHRSFRRLEISGTPGRHQGEILTAIKRREQEAQIHPTEEKSEGETPDTGPLPVIPGDSLGRRGFLPLPVLAKPNPTLPSGRRPPLNAPRVYLSPTGNFTSEHTKLRPPLNAPKPGPAPSEPGW